MKKLDVNQELCRKVEIMLKGAKSGEVAALLGISKATVSRIKAAGFDPEQYARNTQKRVEEENRAAAEPEAELLMDGNGIHQRVTGQMEMDLQPAEELPPVVMTEEDLQTKMMRFLGGKFDNVGKAEATIAEKLDKVIDYMAQILRKMDGVK